MKEFLIGFPIVLGIALILGFFFWLYDKNEELFHKTLYYIMVVGFILIGLVLIGSISYGIGYEILH